MKINDLSLVLIIYLIEGEYWFKYGVFWFLYCGMSIYMKFLKNVEVIFKSFNFRKKYKIYYKNIFYFIKNW